VDVVSPDVQAALEALLFASDEPLPLARIAEVLEVGPDEAQAAVDAVRAACEVPGRGLVAVEIAGGIRLVTRPEVAPVLLRLQRLRLKSRLSRAAVETLAIVAYRQPLSRPEIEQLRGVGAESVVAHLLERRLVRIVGRKNAPGRPILYGTTREFLEHFGLRDLAELPPFEVPAEAGPTAAGPADAGGEAAPEPAEGREPDDEADPTAIATPDDRDAVHHET
jgi:segregation and condensation protein B